MDTQETSIYTAVLIITMVLCTVVIAFIYIIVRQQRRYQAFSKANIASGINMLEQERIRIAENLHDEFGPTLFASRMKFMTVETLSAENEALQNNGLQHLENVIRNLRNITTQIMPSSLFEKDLVTALEIFFQDIKASYPLQLSFNVNDLPDFPEPGRINVFRIIQEIIFNTLKHAKANSLTIEIYRARNSFIISTADDGIGFNYKEAIRRGNGLGLQHIFNRVRSLQGQVHIRSYKNKGVCFYITIPLKFLYENNSNNTGRFSR